MTPLRELYDLYYYYYPNPAKEERRRQLLAEIPTDTRDEDNYGRTSLHIAAEFADCEAIASLLDRGAGVNDRDEEGHTPLFRLASRRSRVPALEEPIATAARLLLERGANLPRSARGTTALLEAVQNRHHAMAAVLIDSGQRLDSREQLRRQCPAHSLPPRRRYRKGDRRQGAFYRQLRRTMGLGEAAAGDPRGAGGAPGGTDALLCDGGTAAPQRADRPR